MTDSTNPKDRLGMLKPDLSTLPPAGAVEQARAQQDGVRKYGLFNWRTKKVRAMIYIAAAMRHLMAYLDGEDYSRDTGYVVLNNDPDRNWFMVHQVAVQNDPESGDAGVEMEWPTPDNLERAIYVTLVGLPQSVSREDFTIVQYPVHHLGHAMACCAILLDARANDALVDDRPTAGAASDLFARYTLKKPPEVPKASEENLDCYYNGKASKRSEHPFCCGKTPCQWSQPSVRRTSEMQYPENMMPGPDGN